MSVGFRTRAIRTVIDGISFPSRLEANLYGQLKNEERAGLIKNLVMQARVDPESCPLCERQAAPSVKVDFKAFDVTLGEDVWHESKGIRSKRYRDFEAWWKENGPGRLRVYTAGRKGSLRMTEIMPEHMNRL